MFIWSLHLPSAGGSQQSNYIISKVCIYIIVKGGEQIKEKHTILTNENINATIMLIKCVYPKGRKVAKVRHMEGYQPGAECSICKGRCCKERGCSLAPQDMWRALGREADEASRRREEALILQGDAEESACFRSNLLELVNQPDGLYALDYFSEKDGPCFYLRMRHKCYTFIGVDAIGECVALTKEGCSLTEAERPKGGRFLESKANGQCVQHYTREEMCADWTPYKKVLKSIWEEYHAKFKEDGTFDRCDNDYFAWMREAR